MITEKLISLLAQPTEGSGNFPTGSFPSGGTPAAGGIIPLNLTREIAIFGYVFTVGELVITALTLALLIVSIWHAIAIRRIKRSN